MWHIFSQRIVGEVCWYLWERFPLFYIVKHWHTCLWHLELWLLSWYQGNKWRWLAGNRERIWILGNINEPSHLINQLCIGAFLQDFMCLLFKTFHLFPINCCSINILTDMLQFELQCNLREVTSPFWVQFLRWQREIEEQRGKERKDGRERERLFCISQIISS